MVGQLRSICRDLGLAESGPQSDDPAEPARVHAALLAGLLSHVGMRREDGREYLGARNSRFVLAPGSVLTKRPPRWVVVAELVETSRLYGRIAARIQPEVVERVAGELAQRSYSEPHWDAKRGEVMAYERVTLYGVPLAARRRVGYSRVEPTVARQLFIRHALVEGDWQTRHHVFADNARLRTQLEELEERAADAACWSMTMTSMSSTTPASPPRSSPHGTSTRGGKSSATRRRICSPLPEMSCCAAMILPTPIGRTPGRPTTRHCP
ncbi:oligonucleotide/oligosaccharide-binding (OB)-fold family protein [Mycobacterium ulcerans str. Harvey]|uniref:Oligonucleotide/oligosaccharide-binding (OB)-fold family protein n=1 Tax=Mycobacterium ulcerans str. Harvey TaxID=1299332 RepID=A0ABN0QZI3_MYCUL|nr:oligonucleotide/oligosaccharide-binding (OB)-fold family protein [Mycobacterium ulcerans str. Harvey]